MSPIVPNPLQPSPPFSPTHQYLVIILPRTSIMGTVDQEMETMIIVTSCVAVGLLLLGWVVVIFLTALRGHAHAPQGGAAAPEGGDAASPGGLGGQEPVSCQHLPRPADSHGRHPGPAGHNAVEAGRMQLEVLEFDIVGELESLVDMFSVQGLSNGTGDCSRSRRMNIERTVKGDPSRVRQ
ncbi:unnamed protein product, partial [Closterium sp. NIES-64]